MKKKTIIANLLLGLLIFGCQPSTTMPTHSPNTIATFPAKLAPTASVIASITIIPTASQTPEPLTPTPLPTISAGTTKESLTQFVQENGGCQLPCVLGLTPGLSDKMMGQGFVHDFQDNANGLKNKVNILGSTKNNQGGILLMFIDSDKSVSITLDYFLDGNTINQILLSGSSSQTLEGGGAKKQFGLPYFDTLLSAFTLPQILATYGLPSQILVRPFPDYVGHPSPPAQYTFAFILLYPDKGFLVEYISERLEQNGFFVGCRTKPYSLNLSAWDPNEPLTLLEAVQNLSGLEGISDQNAEAFKPMEDVTALSTKDFYEIFKNANSEACIKTPKELWPLDR